MVLGPVLLHGCFALLSLFHGSLVDFLYVLVVADRLLVTFVCLVVLSKDCLYLFVQPVPSVSHE